jgi:aldose 1-epimerase
MEQIRKRSEGSTEESTYMRFEQRIANRIAGVIFLMSMAAVAAAQGVVTKASFGKLADGSAVDIYTLKTTGLEVRLTTFGARVVSIETPDRAGKVADVALGYNTLDEYVADKQTYLGSIVGRYGNRIAHGSFSIDGKTYNVPKNNGPNSLHGGLIGFDRKVWQAHEVPGGVEFTLVSPDGDQGYPGTLTAHVKYTVHAPGTLRIDYSATTDKPTVLNLTNHTYFNLAGEGHGTILDEKVKIDADAYTPVDAGLIPTGELAPVKGTPFDFTHPIVIGARINEDNQQLKYAGGYDVNWVVRGKAGELRPAAEVIDPTSGRTLTVETTQPGVQFYTGNSLPGLFKGRSGVVYGKNMGLCLETQHFPDSPNHPSFPSTELKPGATMHQTTVFRFGVEK